MHVTETS